MAQMLRVTFLDDSEREVPMEIDGNEPMQTAFEGFFTKKNVSQRIAEKIKFYVGDAKLDGSKTPEQLNIADGAIIKTFWSGITVKIAGYGRKVYFETSKKKKIGALFAPYNQKKQIDTAAATFSYKGVVLTGEETPSALDMRDNDTIDVEVTADEQEQHVEEQQEQEQEHAEEDELNLKLNLELATDEELETEQEEHAEQVQDEQAELQAKVAELQRKLTEAEQQLNAQQQQLNAQEQRLNAQEQQHAARLDAIEESLKQILYPPSRVQTRSQAAQQDRKRPNQVLETTKPKKDKK